jgi:hypothetical protein
VDVRGVWIGTGVGTERKAVGAGCDLSVEDQVLEVGVRVDEEFRPEDCDVWSVDWIVGAIKGAHDIGSVGVVVGGGSCMGGVSDRPV